MPRRPHSALLRVQLAIAELEAAERELQRELEADDRPQLRVIAGGEPEPSDRAGARERRLLSQPLAPAHRSHRTRGILPSRPRVSLSRKLRGPI